MRTVSTRTPHEKTFVQRKQNMPFEVTNKAFEDVFGKEKDKQKNDHITKDFLDSLQTYLEGQDGRSPRKILAWMKKGGKLSAFTCREDVLFPMISAMRGESVPYVLVKETTGNMGILIRMPETEKVKKLIRKVLKEQSSYCTVTTGDEAEKAYLRSKIEDKMMIQIGGLTEEEALYLEKLCHRVLGNEIIGIDTMPDGTKLFTCHGKTAMSGAREKLFRSAVAETALVMNGESSDRLREYEQNVSTYRRQRAAGFPDMRGTMDEPVWVVGDGERFVKRTAEGFELGHALEIDDNVLLETDLIVDASDKRYETRLNSALSKITGHVCLYDIRDVIEWFRTKRNYWQDKAVTGQKILIEHADKMVAKKIRKDSTMRMEGKWDKKLSHYQQEASKLIAAAAGGKIPPGYTREDIHDLRNVIKLFDLDTGKMQPALDKMLKIETYEKEAGPKKVQDVQKHIEQQGSRDSQERDTSRSRTPRGRGGEIGRE